jgi:hypothetical protein
VTHLTNRNRKERETSNGQGLLGRFKRAPRGFCWTQIWLFHDKLNFWSTFDLSSSVGRHSMMPCTVLRKKNENIIFFGIFGILLEPEILDASDLQMIFFVAGWSRPKTKDDSETTDEAEIEPLIIDRGPYFDKSASKNVTALVGKTTYLNCRIRNLGNRTVSINTTRW